MREIEVFALGGGEKRVEPFGAHLDVVVEEQNRLVAQDEIWPRLPKTANGRRLCPGLENEGVGQRAAFPVVVAVEEHVETARLAKVGRLEVFAALDEDEPLALRRRRLLCDAHLSVGV